MDLTYSKILLLRGTYLVHKTDGICQVIGVTTNKIRISNGATILTSIFFDTRQKDYELATDEEIQEYLDSQEKYGVFFIEERNGEREYTHKLVKVFTGDENVKGEHIAQNFYDNNTDTVDDWYMFDGGEVAVRFSSVNIVTKDEYKILNKYCI